MRDEQADRAGGDGGSHDAGSPEGPLVLPGPEVPGTVRAAVATTWVLVGVLGLAAVFTVVLNDQIVRAWASGNPAARELLEQGGMEALRGGSVAVPSFVPVAVVSFVLAVVIAWVLAGLLGGPGAWGARLGLTLMVLFAVVMTVFGLRYDLPAFFVAITVLALLLELVLLGLLWHPRTNDWVRATRGSGA